MCGFTTMTVIIIAAILLGGIAAVSATATRPERVRAKHQKAE
ncbi:MAG: hypothetical protein ACI81R_000874 [Bradymonadia bacterium]|jgi:hypothetical protein